MFPPSAIEEMPKIPRRKESKRFLVKDQLTASDKKEEKKERKEENRSELSCQEKRPTVGEAVGHSQNVDSEVNSDRPTKCQKLWLASGHSKPVDRRSEQRASREE